MKYWKKKKNRMIKITKDTTDIPISLLPAFEDLFLNKKIDRLAKTTHEKRMLLIKNGSYIDSNEFNSRYKLEDIRKKLITIYNHKCAYCEQKVEQYNVEHYRPKSIYYWLAFSWDNLILACPYCNFHKGIKFELGGKAETLKNTDDNIKKINNLSSTYDTTEKPKMVNPEISDPKGTVKFGKDGSIDSDNINFKYTIEECKISRTYLRDGRRKILDDLRKEIALAYSKNDEDEVIPVLRHIITTFKENSQNLKNEFIAFREFAIASGWISEILKEEKEA
ncbi:HNH endonuclease [Flavobacterium johnsoniae]|uniref:TIGR02646 family protein n=1 Tax=Flavobacterium johnsoniae TaxID=986 RepID=A0A1M5QUD7_FLAJO|nr:HNH endonuclease [Flavobacterium johnsoniae]SHH17163.1 TIGR02646 family protein [Flavobacterium johnsoniae]